MYKRQARETGKLFIRSCVMKNLILQLVINSDMQMSEVENMDWNTVVTFLLSDLMIIIYECAGCVILLLLVLRFSRKKKAVDVYKRQDDM